MKSLKLRNLNLRFEEVLQKEQLKTILGGDIGSGDGGCSTCTDDAGIKKTCLYWEAHGGCWHADCECGS